MAGKDRMVRAVGAWMAAALFFGGAAHAQSLNFQVIGGGPVGDGAPPALANLSEIGRAHV